MVAEADRFFDSFPVEMKAVRRELPEMVKAFGALFHSAMGPGELDVREKELIALGIAVALRCVPCINTHTEKCVQAGASRQQVLEAAAVAVVMQGGPTYSHLPHVLDALDALENRQTKSEKVPTLHGDD